MSLMPQVGNPTMEGRYIVFCPVAALQIAGWTEPHIATWHGDKWHYALPIYGWIGPIPVMHSDNFAELQYGPNWNAGAKALAAMPDVARPEAEPEYDL